MWGGGFASKLLWLGLGEIRVFKGIVIVLFFCFLLSGVIVLFVFIAYCWAGSWVWVWVCACLRLAGCLAGVLFRVPNQTEPSLP